MLIRYNVSNFLSYKEEQSLSMISGKNYKRMKEHEVELGEAVVMKNALIYGANASGKTNTIKSLEAFKYMVLNKVDMKYFNSYFRDDLSCKDIPSKFEIEIYSNGNIYAYGIMVELSSGKLLGEWLYKIDMSKDVEELVFERQFDNESNKFKIYISDKLDILDPKNINIDQENVVFHVKSNEFATNQSRTLLNAMNENKNILVNDLKALLDVFNWFENKLRIVYPDQTLSYLDYLSKDVDSGLESLETILKVFDTGISRIEIVTLREEDFYKKLDPRIAKDILQKFNNSIQEQIKNGETPKLKAKLRSKNDFYEFTYRNDEIVIETIQTIHGNKSSKYDFEEESDGTKRLFDLIDILFAVEDDVTYVVDELERSLHPNLIYKFISLYTMMNEKNKSQLIFTTHESILLNLELLRQDEIWFVERNKDSSSTLYSLDQFDERYDKKVDKAYLEGRYGAIPIFKG